MKTKYEQFLSKRSANCAITNIRWKQLSSENKSSKMTIKEIKSDLFSASIDHALAHCVGTDFKMSKGIAVKFKNKFNNIDELLYQNVGVGGSASINIQGRNIFYLVTKECTYGKPSYGTLQSSLVSFMEKCIELKVTMLAMPRIGCGLDWRIVKDMISRTFQDLNIFFTQVQS